MTVMRTAVVDPETGAVTNIIMADPSTDLLPGYRLVAVPDGTSIDTRWCWSEENGFHPGPEWQAELDRKAAEVEAYALDMGE